MLVGKGISVEVALGSSSFPSSVFNIEAVPSSPYWSTTVDGGDVSFFKKGKLLDIASQHPEAVYVDVWPLVVDVLRPFGACASSGVEIRAENSRKGDPLRSDCIDPFIETVFKIVNVFSLWDIHPLDEGYCTFPLVVKVFRNGERVGGFRSQEIWKDNHLWMVESDSFEELLTVKLILVSSIVEDKKITGFTPSSVELLVNCVRYLGENEMCA